VSASGVDGSGDVGFLAATPMTHAGVWGIGE
jgi:hypothetical protein